MKAPPAVAALGILAVVTSIDARRPQQPTQGQPTFRSETMLVPVDVRVLDRAGKPVTDLKQEDFTVLENGVRQEVRYFSARALVVMAPQPGARPAFRTRASPAVREQQSRIFLIVLGRGRLQAPSRGLDGLIHLVRDRLLPQDQVAVLAYNRATDFTNDHDQIAKVLERYKRAHEGIELSLQHQLGGLAAIYGSREIPGNLQKDIDAVFQGPGAVASRTVVPAEVTGASTMAADSRRAADAVLKAEAEAGLEVRTRDVLDEINRENQPDSLATYARLSVQTSQDIGNLYTGIEYLRYLEGEKHLVFVTEFGMNLGRVEAETGLAARANHARVVIDTIQTGGIDPGPPPTASSPAPPIPSMSFTFMDQSRIMGLRTVSDLTGGLSSARQYARQAVDRIDSTTRFGYLLGYYPANTARDPRYRRIIVRVNRPGLQVLYRHGYYGDEAPPPIDRRSYLIQRRIAAATSYAKDVEDIKITVRPSATRPDRSTDVAVDVFIDISHVEFTTKDERRVASLEMAIACGDQKERIIGRSRQTLDLKIRDESFQRYLREGLPISAYMSSAVKPRFVKIVVYDYEADLVGSTTIRLK